MKKKYGELLFCLIFFIITISWLKHSHQSHLVIMLISLGLSIITPFFSLIYFNKQEQNKYSKEFLLSSNFEYQKWKVKDSKKLINKIIIISKNFEIKIPKIIIVEYPEHLAYAYQSYEKQGVIKISTFSLLNYNKETLTGVISHEFSHLKNQDSLKSLGRSSIAIFLLTISYFYASNLIGIILSLFFFIELVKIRSREYDADYLAAKKMGNQIVLNYMIDSISIQRKKINLEKEKTINVLQKKDLLLIKDKIFALINLLKIYILNYTYNNLGTHPNWNQRIYHLLLNNDINITNRELNVFIKKMLFSKYKKANGTYINLKKSQINPEFVTLLLK